MSTDLSVEFVAVDTRKERRRYAKQNSVKLSRTDFKNGNFRTKQRLFTDREARSRQVIYFYGVLRQTILLTPAQTFYGCALEYPGQDFQAKTNGIQTQVTANQSSH